MIMTTDNDDGDQDDEKDDSTGHPLLNHAGTENHSNGPFFHKNPLLVTPQFQTPPHLQQPNYLGAQQLPEQVPPKFPP